MHSLTYAPVSTVYVITDRSGGSQTMYDVSKSIISGSVTLNVDAANTGTVTIANSRGRYNGVFRTLDRIVVILQRLPGQPQQVLTGYLNEPKWGFRFDDPITLTFLGTLKRALITYFEPYATENLSSLMRRTVPEVLQWLMGIAGYANSDIWIQPYSASELSRFNELSTMETIPQTTHEAVVGGDLYKLYDVIVKYASLNGLQPLWIAAVIQRESSWKADAYRYEPHLGEASYGLMQVLESTARNFGLVGDPKTMYDPETSIRIGSAYLGYCYKHWHDDVYMVAEYGAGHVAARDKSKPLSHTNLQYQETVDKYIKFKQQLADEVASLAKRSPSADEMRLTALQHYADTTFATKGDTRITFPVPGRSIEDIPITDKFGGGRNHTGIDFGVGLGTSIIAALPGTVRLTADLGGSSYGRYVIIDHSGGVSTLYAHLSKISVSKGQSVQAGTQIGLSGTTGNSTGPHLHFEIRLSDQYQDPFQYLSGAKTVDQLSNSGYGVNVLNPYDQNGASPSEIEEFELFRGARSPFGFDLSKINDVPLFPWITKVANFGKYRVTEDGSGHVLFKLPNYFGAADFTVTPIEFVEGSYSQSDDDLITHLFVAGDPGYTGSVSSEDFLMCSGVASVENMSDVLKSTGYSVVEFLNRYKIRPKKETEPLLRTAAQAQFYAEYLFQRYWAQLLKANIQITYMPELRPLMNVKFESMSNSVWTLDGAVTHTFGDNYSTSLGNVVAGKF